MLYDHPFTKDNLDKYLKELAKEFRKRSGKNMPAEITLIGDASVVINYGFRETTYDMDAIINASSAMKEAINYVGDRYELPNGWLNTDFIKTRSFTPKLVQYSRFYKTYSNVVTFRTVTGEYLVAMKLMSGRQYKYDMSDVIGILLEHRNIGAPISLDMIKKAAENLYDSYENIPEFSRLFIENAISSGNYDELFESVRQMEIENKDLLLQFQDDYPGETKSDNVDEIIASIRRKKDEGK